MPPTAHVALGLNATVHLTKTPFPPSRYCDGEPYVDPRFLEQFAATDVHRLAQSSERAAFYRVT